jgi:hypothetical protein
VFLSVGHNWGEDRVFFLDDDGVHHSLPVGWTDAASPDVFVTVAAGRSLFRVEDLIALAGLVAQLSNRHAGMCKADSAVGVRNITP